jgi:hypothetical protein
MFRYYGMARAEQDRRRNAIGVWAGVFILSALLIALCPWLLFLIGWLKP